MENEIKIVTSIRDFNNLELTLHIQRIYFLPPLTEFQMTKKPETGEEMALKLPLYS
jgi:hypothetical protein